MIQVFLFPEFDFIQEDGEGNGTDFAYCGARWTVELRIISCNY